MAVIFKTKQISEARLRGEKTVTRRKEVEGVRAVILSFIVLALCSTAMFAQSVKVQGTIKGRSGATMTLQTQDSPAVVVLLTEDTKVAQVQGVLKRAENRCR